MKKDRIRKEYLRQLNNKIAWNLINKYKISLEKNSNKSNIAIIITNNYKGFLNELKSNKLNTTTNYKYIRLWETLINTAQKSFFEKFN